MATNATVIANKSGIGTSAVQLTAASTPVSYGVLVTASNLNSTNYVSVGLANTVIVAAADATDGLELAKSQSVFIPAAIIPLGTRPTSG